MKINKCVNCGSNDLVNLKSDKNQYALPVYNPKTKTLELNKFLPIDIKICKNCGLIIPISDYFEKQKD